MYTGGLRIESGVPLARWELVDFHIEKRDSEDEDGGKWGGGAHGSPATDSEGVVLGGGRPNKLDRGGVCGVRECEAGVSRVAHLNAVDG